MTVEFEENFPLHNGRETNRLDDSRNMFAEKNAPLSKGKQVMLLLVAIALFAVSFVMFKDLSEKKNEVKVLPFDQLPKEEQQRILDKHGIDLSGQNEN